VNKIVPTYILASCYSHRFIRVSVLSNVNSFTALWILHFDYQNCKFAEVLSHPLGIINEAARATLCCPLPPKIERNNLRPMLNPIK
jgi:hypothetical protein